MTLDEISKKHKVPLKHIKTLARAGLLVFKKEDARILQMKKSLRSAKHLSVWHCLTLIREPALLADLGVHQERAKSQLDAIGKIKRGFGPNSHHLIFGAAILETIETNELAERILAELPPGLSYHALALRLLWDVPPERVRNSANYVAKAITNLRNHPALQNWFAGTVPLSRDNEMLDL